MVGKKANKIVRKTICLNDDILTVYCGLVENDFIYNAQALQVRKITVILLAVNIIKK